MICARFQGKPFNITVIQVYAPTTNAKEAEVEQFYEDQAGIKIAKRNINNLRHPDDTTIMAESEKELKSLWFWYQYSAWSHRMIL